VPGQREGVTASPARQAAVRPIAPIPSADEAPSSRPGRAVPRAAGASF
jgi:hypothetical protein